MWGYISGAYAFREIIGEQTPDDLVLQWASWANHWWVLLLIFQRRFSI